MEQKPPDQLNIAKVSDDGFTLEDILREFGSDAAHNVSKGAGEPSQAPKTAQTDEAATKGQPVPKKQTSFAEQAQPSTAFSSGAEPDVKEYIPKSAASFSKKRSIAAPRSDSDAPVKIAAIDKKRAAAHQETAPSDRDTAKAPMGDTLPIPPQREATKNDMTENTVVFSAVSDADFVPPQVIRLQERAEASPPSSEAADSQAFKQLLKKTRSGLGILRIRTWLVGLLFLLSLSLELPAVRVLIPIHSWLPPVFLCIAATFSFEVLFRGLKDLITLRISPHTLTTTALVLSFLHRFGLAEGHSYDAILCLLLFFQLRSLYLERAGKFFTLRTLCGFDRPTGIYVTATENGSSLRRDLGDPEDLMSHLPRPDLTAKLMRIYCTLLLPALPLTAYLLRGDFLHTWLFLILCALPGAGSLSFVRPFRSLAKRLSSLGGALCGWHSAATLGGNHTLLLRDKDLFPDISSNGMKLYYHYDAARVISYGLAAMETVDSPLKELFSTLLREHHGKPCHPIRTRIYDGGGVGLEIRDDVVLAGSLPFMRTMGVYMPEGTRLKSAVYISINGELAGVFAIKYKASASSKKGLKDVLANRHLSIILAARDFLITPALIAAKYQLPTASIQCPGYGEQLRLSNTDPDVAAAQGGLIDTDSFGAFASTVAAGHSLRSASLLTFGLSLFAGLLGLVLGIGLTLWNAAIPPILLAAFQFLWAFLSFFISTLLT